MNSPEHSTNYLPLRLALLSNAVFSLVAGTVLAFASDWTALLLGGNLPPSLLLWIGASLLPFGIFVAGLAARRTPTPWVALLVSLTDLAWVGGSVIYLAFQSESLRDFEVFVIALVSACILGFVVGQLRGIARVLRWCRIAIPGLLRHGKHG